MPHEQRRTTRVRSKGWIRVYRGPHTINGRVIDLGTGGVSMLADGATGLETLAGSPVEVDLRLDESATMLFSLHGRVVRASSATGIVAIELLDVGVLFEKCIARELCAASDYDASPHVILVDAACAQRDSIANAFRAGGCKVTEVSTPWEAIAHIDRNQFEPSVIAIADTQPEQVAEELREFLRVEHPQAHMVAIGRSSLDRDPASSWLSGSDPNSDVVVRVGRVITAHAARHEPRHSGR
ncbi:MAG TPA: PilZ domain-containing protein [Kofleriaceae bacterium]|nr:PilZ domain-containing protein [Kofleriaceae bacterium]